MAGVKGRSGGANGGPQYNPANINLLGGNGQSGKGSQAPKYISGLPYGQGQATMQQQKGAKIAGPTPSFNMGSARMGESASMATPLTAPSEFPDEHITTGAPIGNTPGPETLAMPQPQQDNTPNDPDLDLVREYFPIIELWAQQVDTSQGTKDYVNYLRTIL
jgi:hypothetical protein